MEAKIRRFGFSEEKLFQLALQIREDVFVKEQGVDKKLEFDPAQDQEAHHYLYYLQQEAVATARWRETPKGIKLERFAVLPAFRNQGIGKIVLDEVLQDILPLAKKIYLHAQEDAVNFYLRNGFVICGDKFFEAGIGHYKMEYAA
jgi:predicted GNAT family N-acyltransferase